MPLGGPGRKIAAPTPSFSMYQTYAILADSEPVLFPLTADGFVDPDTVIDFAREQQLEPLLIICNPNNPTGNYNSHEAMEKIIRNVECPVIMDEAYMEFSVEGGGIPAPIPPWTWWTRWTTCWCCGLSPKPTVWPICGSATGSAAKKS